MRFLRLRRKRIESRRIYNRNRVKADANRRPYSFGACALTFAATLGATTASGLAVVFGSRWLARAFSVINYFIFVLIGSTAVMAVSVTSAVYFIATRWRRN